jgi:hypothetical protein
MSDVVIILTAALSILVIALIGLLVWRGKNKSDEPEEAVRRVPRGIPLRPNNEDGPRRAGRRVPARRQNVQEDDEFDDDGDELADEIAMPMDGKLGVKKRMKLQAKAEKRANRESELQEREERKQRQQLLDEERKREDDKFKAEETKRLEEEKRIKEEEEKRELEEYLKMKEAFAVEEEGYDEDAEETQTTNKLQLFIEYIQNQKVVLLEDLAGHFQMKTQDVINRVQDLLAQEILVGVIDDRGKFIYITKEELESVAKFVRQRGRVSIAELVESSNSLINLQPEQSK